MFLRTLLLFALVGFGLIPLSVSVHAQSQNVIEDTLRQLPPEVSVPIRQQIRQDQARVERDVQIMNGYHDLVVAGSATGQDTQACREAEHDARNYMDTIIGMYQSDRGSISNALRIQIAAEVESVLLSTNPCPDQPTYNALGKNAFARAP